MLKARRISGVAALALLAGCSSGPRYCPHCGADLKAPAVSGTQLAPVASTPALAPTSYHQPPAKLVERITTTLGRLNLPVEASKDGVIQTGWKDFEGEFHIARRWQERSRFRVRVVPDIADPANSAGFEVSEETQHRSNDRATWQAAGARPERAREIANAISQDLLR